MTLSPKGTYPMAFLPRHIGQAMMRLSLLALLALTVLAPPPASYAAQAASPALTATTWFVNASTGNDANAGTQTSPFKTLKKALSVAQAGDTVKLAKGSYSKQGSGDTYPLLVPAGVSILGTLQTNGAKGSSLGPSSSAA